MKKIIAFMFLLMVVCGCKKNDATDDQSDTSEIAIDEPAGTNLADYVYISNNTAINTTIARINLATFGSFFISNAANTPISFVWGDDDINSTLKAIIALHYTPAARVKYKVTYIAFINGKNVPSTKYFHLNAGLLVVIP
jgi:hypothetical protein